MTFQARHTNVAFPKQETGALSKAQRTGAFDGSVAVALSSCVAMVQHFAQECGNQCAIMTQHLAQGSQRVQIHTSYFRYC